MKYHSVDEYLRYTGLEEEHPELVRLLQLERIQQGWHLDELYDRINDLEEELV